MKKVFWQAGVGGFMVFLGFIGASYFKWFRSRRADKSNDRADENVFRKYTAKDLEDKGVVRRPYTFDKEPPNMTQEELQAHVDAIARRAGPYNHGTTW